MDGRKTEHNITLSVNKRQNVRYLYERTAIYSPDNPSGSLGICNTINIHPLKPSPAGGLGRLLVLFLLLIHGLGR